MSDAELTLKGRIVKFQKSLGAGGQGVFEASVGIAKGTLSKPNSLGSGTIEKIKELYPQISLEWLFTGVGDMIISETKTSPTEAAEDVKKAEVNPEDIMALLREIKDEQKVISANLKTISNPPGKSPAKPQEKSLEAEKVEKVARRSAEIRTPGYGKKNDPLPKKATSK